MPSYSHVYDSVDFDPAMPVAEISLISLLTGESAVELFVAVDSGADATMLPINALTAAGAHYLRARRLRGVTGQAVTVDTYLTNIQIGSKVVHGVEAVALPLGNEAILGRDVLNQLTLILNGPAQELWID